MCVARVCPHDKQRQPHYTDGKSFRMHLECVHAPGMCVAGVCSQEVCQLMFSWNAAKMERQEVDMRVLSKGLQDAPGRWPCSGDVCGQRMSPGSAPACGSAGMPSRAPPTHRCRSTSRQRATMAPRARTPRRPAAPHLLQHTTHRVPFALVS